MDDISSFPPNTQHYIYTLDITIIVCHTPFMISLDKSNNGDDTVKRPENERMEKFLFDNGIKAKAKYWWKGSMKRTWTIQSRTEKWSDSLMDKFVALGFINFDGFQFRPYHNSGEELYICVTGHYEMVENVAAGSL